MEQATTTLTIRLPKDLKDALTETCRENDMTPSQYIRRLIRATLVVNLGEAVPKVAKVDNANTTGTRLKIIQAPSPRKPYQQPKKRRK